MKWRWLGLGAVVVIGGCNTAIAIAAHIDATESLAEGRESLGKQIAKVHERFLDDQHTLAALPLFSPRRGADAGALLFAKMPLAPLDEPPAAAVLDVDLGSADTAWMGGLAAFDTWDLFAAPAVAAERSIALDAMPLPPLADADTWARIRLVQALQQKSGVAAAGHDVTELSRLLISTEHVRGTLVAIDIMRDARSAFDHATRAGMDTGGWQPMSDDDINRWSRAALAWRALADVHADPAVIRADWASAETGVGRCAALWDAVAFLMAREPIAPGLFDDAHRGITAALTATRDTCRLGRLRDAWDVPGQRSIVTGVEAICDPDEGDCVLLSVLSHFPGLRESLVEDAMGRDWVPFFKGYAPPVKASPPSTPSPK